MQRRNTKLAILAVLAITAAVVWTRGTVKVPDVSSASVPAMSEQIIPVTETAPRKRTEFLDWGRDPFAPQQRENEKEKDNGLSDLRLAAIMWDDNEPTAFVNDLVIRIGDRIADKTVKRIEQNRVILTDGTRDYVLRLQQE